MHGLEAFHDTELDTILRYHGVQTIVLCGVSTNVGIPGTALAAINRGYSVVVPEDCIASGTPEAHDMLIEYTLRLLATMGDSLSVEKALRP